MSSKSGRFHPLHYAYGVTKGEIDKFVWENDAVARWLGKFKESPATYAKYSRGLATFFKWLRMTKGCGVTPQEFLDMVAVKRADVRPSERCWAKNLVLAFSRDNPDLEGNSDSSKLTSYIVPIKRFCADNEVELATEQSLIGKVRRKFAEPQYTIALAKKVLGALNIREKAVCMCELQSGQSNKQILEDMNKQAAYVLRQIQAGKERIRLDFPQRKGNNFAYFSFISKDAITALKDWLPERQRIIEKTGLGNEFLFITEKGTQYTPREFLNIYIKILQRKGLWTGPLSVRAHMFRKIFETESSPPERGINKLYALFMMGHSSGDEVIKRLDVPGGIYDGAPRIYMDSVERQYERLEPYLNIYTGKAALGSGLELSSDELENLRWLAEQVKEGKVRIVKNDS